MVLIRSWGLLAALGLAVAACIPRPTPLKAKTPMMVAVVCVLDAGDTRETVAAPQAVTAKVTAALAARNLNAKAIPAESLALVFATRRTTAHRLASVAEAAGDADLVLLVESDASFYSQLNGRYRWTVKTRATIAKRGKLDDATTSELDFAAFLDFDHQKEQDAVASAAGRMGEIAGRVADDFLGGLGVPLDY